MPFDKYWMAMEEEYPIRARFRMLVGSEEGTEPRYIYIYTAVYLYLIVHLLTKKGLLLQICPRNSV